MAKWTSKSNFIDILLELIDSGVNTASLLSSGSALTKIDERMSSIGDNDLGAKENLKETLSYMKSSSLLKKNSNVFTLTRKARKRLQQRSILFPKTNISFWDGNWRIIMFEIPESKKTKRDAFTSKLKDLGFVYLHKGTLIYPYDVTSEIENIADFYDIQKYISIVKTEKIVSEKLKQIKKQFNLDQ
ncbi:MAG: hypothetical protein M3P98_03740 [bacterium]|nr:hypothetical protein [bacterium]